MFAEKRKENILKLLKNKQTVKVSELSRKFDVSQATIRRDLSELEEEGKILRTHGGAMYRSYNRGLELSVEEKADKYFEEKSVIGKKAAEFIQNGDTIMIDTGTTTARLVSHLKEKEDLTIITNGLNIINKIYESKLKAKVVMVGGNLRPKTGAMVGPLAEDSLEKIRVDKVFLGTNGLNIVDGATTPDISEARIKEKMIEISKEVYILCDHTKLDKVTFSKFADIDDIDYLIVDRLINLNKKQLNEFDVSLIVAE